MLNVVNTGVELSSIEQVSSLVVRRVASTSRNGLRREISSGFFDPFTATPGYFPCAVLRYHSIFVFELIRKEKKREHNEVDLKTVRQTPLFDFLEFQESMLFIDSIKYSFYILFQKRNSAAANPSSINNLHKLC